MAIEADIRRLHCYFVTHGNRLSRAERRNWIMLILQGEGDSCNVGAVLMWDCDSVLRRESKKQMCLKFWLNKLSIQIRNLERETFILVLNIAC